MSPNAPARCLALLLLATVAGGCGFEPRRWDIPAGGTEVPLTLAEHQPGVEVRLNGRGPYRVLVDSGASPAIAITPKLAGELGLGRQLGSVRLHAANGRWVRGDRTTIRRLRLGDAVFHDVPAVIIDLGEPNFDAVIGMGLFGRGVVTFDFPARRLSLRPGSLDPSDPDTFTTPLVYGVPLVPVSAPTESGPRTLYVLLDTGSNTGLILPDSVRDELRTHPGFSGAALADTLGGVRTIDFVKLRGSLSVGRYHATDPVVGLARGRGAIGTPPMQDFQVSIDQRSRRVRLKLTRRTSTPPAAPPAATPAAPVAPPAR
jgi:predicted aspartyl protease